MREIQRCIACADRGCLRCRDMGPIFGPALLIELGPIGPPPGTGHEPLSRVCSAFGASGDSHAAQDAGMAELLALDPFRDVVAAVSG